MGGSDDVAFDEEVARRLTTRTGAVLQGAVDGRGLRVAVACARFNGALTTRLLEGCLDGLVEAGVDPADVTVAWVPGAFELPTLAQRCATSGRFDAVVCLGAVVRGETGHYDLVAGECARGIQDATRTTGVPVIFGVLTTENVGQALERSAPDETNTGREAAHSAVEMARLLADPRLG